MLWFCVYGEAIGLQQPVSISWFSDAHQCLYAANQFHIRVVLNWYYFQPKTTFLTNSLTSLIVASIIILEK